MLLVLVSACGDADPKAEPPLIRQFTVDGAGQVSVPAGRPVVLAWDVSGAERVRLSADPGGLLTAESALAGTFRSPPLTATTQFLLRAEGPGGEASKVVTARVEPATGVQIEFFRAVPGEVLPGESASLSWEVQRAEQLRIDVIGGAPLLEGDPRPNGTLNVTPAVTQTYVLTASGRGGPQVAAATVEVLGSPRVLAFRAEPARITRGATVRLLYRVENADRVMILDSAGAVQHSSAEPAGEVELQPQQEERYTLSLAREGFPEVRAELRVEVEVPPGARWLRIQVDPAELPYGDRVNVSLAAENAVDGLSARFRGRELFRGAGPEAEFSFTPTVSGSLSLLASNLQEGDASESRAITVRPEAPRILALAAHPALAILGRPFQVVFETRGADALRLIGPDETRELDPSGPEFTSLIATSTASRLTLEAENRFGTTTRALEVPATDRPVVDAFIVTPELFDAPAATATVSYVVRNATWLELVGPGGASSALPTPFLSSGRWHLAVDGSGFVRLHAQNAVASTWAARPLRRLEPEQEPNDAPQSAQPLLGDGGGVRARLNDAADLDLYELAVEAGARLDVLLGRRELGCEDLAAVELRLLGPDAVSTLATAAEDAAEACLSIRAAGAPGARDLPAGPLWLELSGPGPLAYVLTASVSNP